MKRVILFGGSSFIGLKIIKALQKYNVDVINFSRKKVSFVKNIEWHLGHNNFNNFRFYKNDKIIVLCHDYQVDHENYVTTNVANVSSLISYLIRKTNSEIYFFSSYSAHDQSDSLYGKTKYLIEQKFKNKIKIVRPGLVIGNGGTYKNIKMFVMPAMFESISISI